jgi:hypothetical protein
LFYFVSS